uniref:Matrix protein n=1 Tax=Lobos virus TaxID=3139875 RepID=A0AAN0LIN8_9VIRU
MNSLNVLCSVNIVTSLPVSDKELFFVVGQNIIDDYSGPIPWKNIVPPIFLAALNEMNPISGDEDPLIMEGEFNEVLRIHPAYVGEIPERKLIYRDRFVWPFKGIRYVVNLKMELSRSRVPGIDLLSRLDGVPQEIKSLFVRENGMFT